MAQGALILGYNTHMSSSRHDIVPYLPVLGPVHPLEVNDATWKAIADAGSRMLPYDKTSRWSDDPTEEVVRMHTYPGGRIVMTRTISGRTRRYEYGSVDTKLIEDDGLAATERITFSVKGRPLQVGERANHIFFDYFSDEPVRVSGHVQKLTPHLQKAWDAFASSNEDEEAIRGLQMSIQRSVGPMYVYEEDGTIMGAIGPLNTLPDSRGVNRLLPCYFFVALSYRQRGIGKALWRSMRAWAVQNGAEYIVLQAEVGADAEAFYRSMGLHSLGFVYKLVEQ